MNADDVKRSFADWVNGPSNTFPERLALRDMEVWILKESAAVGELSNDIHIRATEQEWVDYYRLVSDSDGHPISLMWLHLNEVVAEAEKHGGDTAVIWRGGFRMVRSRAQPCR